VLYPWRDATGAAEAVEQAGRPGQGQLAEIQGEHFTGQEVEEASGPVGKALAGLGPAEVGEGGLPKLVEKARLLGRARHSSKWLAKSETWGHMGKAVPNKPLQRTPQASLVSRGATPSGPGHR
jgi:hypothetical protein